MTREEQIKQAAEEFADRERGSMRDVSVFNLLQYAFKCGAEWGGKYLVESFNCERRWSDTLIHLGTAEGISISETTTDE